MTRTNGSLPHTFLTVNLAGENQLTAPCWARTVYNRSRWHWRGIMESSASMTTTKRAVMSWEERQDADSFRAERASESAVGPGDRSYLCPNDTRTAKQHCARHLGLSDHPVQGEVVVPSSPFKTRCRFLLLAPGKPLCFAASFFSFHTIDGYYSNV